MEFNWLMPNQRALSAINVYMDPRTKSINAKPMGKISVQCLQGHKHATINAKSMGTILNLFIKKENHYSLAVNCTESLYQLTYLRFICYKLKLIEVIKFLRRHLYHMIKTIMLRIYSTVKTRTIKMYVIIYHMIKLIMLRIYLKRSSNALNNGFYVTFTNINSS